MRYFNCTKLELHTFRHWLDGDDFTGVSSSRRRDGHHPDAVLTVPAEVGDAVEEHIWSSFKLAAHLWRETLGFSDGSEGFRKLHTTLFPTRGHC